MNDVIIGAWVAFFLLVRKVAFSIIVHWTASTVEKNFGKAFAVTERKKIIWEHFLNNAKAEGHSSKRVTECDEASCLKLVSQS